MSLQDELVRVRTGTPADLPVLRGLFRRSSLSNEGDRERLLATPHTLKFSGEGLAEGRTRVAVGIDGTIVGFRKCSSHASALHKTSGDGSQNELHSRDS